MPTLILVGARDLPDLQNIADSLASRIPNAGKIVLPGGGHHANLDHPEVFNRMIIEFLEEVEQGSPMRTTAAR